jgi:hypothetical protein
MVTVNPEQVMKILELTDSFNLHRETVVIPLGTEGKGDVVLLPDQRLRITVPSNTPFMSGLLNYAISWGRWICHVSVIE